MFILLGMFKMLEILIRMISIPLYRILQAVLILLQLVTILKEP